LLDELSKDVVEDTTVLVVGDFDISIKSDKSLEADTTAGLNFEFLTNLKVTTVEGDVESFSSLKTKRVSILTFLELEGQDTHTNKVASVDSFVRLSNNNLDTLEVGALSSPISG